MTISPFWTSVAALWAAFLSTWLALPSILKFHVEPKTKSGDDLTVRIVNPTKRMRFVRQLCCFPFPGSGKTLPVYTDQMLKDSPGRRGRLWIALKSESEAMVHMNWIMESEVRANNRWLVIFGWQGAWIVPWVWVPVPVYVSTARANRLNAAE
jgi:hypothetical protein